MENKSTQNAMTVVTHKNTNRIEYIDIMKAIGIILVIVGHCQYTSLSLVEIICSFHMPLFFFAYGLAIRPKKEYTEETFKAFLVSRIRGLLVPYFIWALIWSDFTVGNIIKIFYGSNQTLELINPHLWFLPCMFVASVMFELIRWGTSKIKINKYIVYTLTIFICMVACVFIPTKYLGYPFGIDIAICATIFIALGYIIKDVAEKINKTHILLIIMIISCLGLALYKYNIHPRWRWCNYGTSKIL